MVATLSNAPAPGTTRAVFTDETALREFMRTECPRLVAALGAMLGSRDAAEDAVQEALARAWERSERGEEIESLKAWVLTVATNLVRSRLRRLRTERRAQQLLELEALGGSATSGNHVSGVVRDRLDVTRAVAGLPRRQREVTVLRYVGDLEVAEIARVLCIREGTAKSSLYQARQALAAALGEESVQEAEEESHAGR